jgi:NADPH2:quinone reductase
VRAIVLDPAAGSLRPSEVADPEPGPHEVLIRVRAAGLNRADLLARAGSYPTGSAAAEPVVAGLELAGEVVSCGAEVPGVAAGARVMSIGRGYAQLACVDHRLLLPVPDSFSWEQAGATPIALLTAHDALVSNGRLARGESVLIQAVTSGVGTMALAIALELAADPIIGTSRSAAKLEALDGELVGVDVTADDLLEVVQATTDGRGIDVIVDNVGAAVLAQNIAAAAIRGRIVQIGRLGGARAGLDLEELARKRLTLVGVTFRTRSAEERAEIVRRCLADLGERLATGKLAPSIEAAYPLDEAEQAQDALARNEHVGKLVLSVP